jgi:hypothetical protein
MTRCVDVDTQVVSDLRWCQETLGTVAEETEPIEHMGEAVAEDERFLLC